jgi:geranylgeranyl reductase family protein
MDPHGAQRPGAQFEVCIIGAGPAGSAAALFLAKGGLRVALLDKSDFPRDKTCGDGLTPRAIRTLETMGVLPRIEACAFRAAGIKLRYSDELIYPLEIDQLEDLPHYLLTMPRFRLDDLLRQFAVEAGATFFPEARVEDITRVRGEGVQIHTTGGPGFLCDLAVIAAGANSSLLQRLGLLRRPPPINLAARAYFENIRDLDDSLILFFDGVDLPGYGWVFPTGEGTANVGCGVFFEGPGSQASQLRSLIDEHPYLRRLLADARQVGPVKGFPVRTDFSPAHSGNAWILVIGEATGLVNPITGEGIDYALESAQLAADAILSEWRGGPPSGAIQSRYRTGLRQRFQNQLALNRLAQRVYFRRGTLSRLLRRASERPALRKAIVDACFGTANPNVMFTPRVLRDVFL